MRLKEFAYITDLITKVVRDLGFLQPYVTFVFFTNEIETGVNELITLSLIADDPVVTSTRLTEDKVVCYENMTKRS